MFGHFELPHFLMNARVEMPDHGEVKVDDFTGIEKVFSGHFHMRQQKGNIRYIGNCFPHNFADAGDANRGMMVMEWDKDEEYFAWPGQPLYRVMKLSEAIDHGKDIFKPNMHVRVELDIDISYEEANFIKETFIPEYNLRELMLIPEKVEVESNAVPIDINFESVDTIVMNQINAIDSETYERGLLLDIYRNL
jgi:hypothetical protein